MWESRVLALDEGGAAPATGRPRWALRADVLEVSEAYDTEGYETEGYETEGYETEGYETEGYETEGYDTEGYDTEGYDTEAYEAYGFEDEDFAPSAIAAGSLTVASHPILAKHVGTRPDLLVRWGAMTAPATVDVVVHLHGWASQGRAMRIDRDKLPMSGLDLTDPSGAVGSGRVAPTLLVLPRGNSGAGPRYGHPALAVPGAIDDLVEDAIQRFNAHTGASARRGRLILTAHSGGGAALMAILRHTDPDEVYAFDALYTDAGPLIAWAKRRLAAGTGALRVLFRAGEGTAAQSLRVAAAIGAGSPAFRVEQTTVGHNPMPRTYGWRLLADAAADVPGAKRPAVRGTREFEAFETEAFETETFETETFETETLDTFEALVGFHGFLSADAWNSIKGAHALAQGPNLRRGSSGAAVEHLQRCLNQLGHSLVVDGLFGPKTDAAVRAFQTSRGLVVDGIVGPKTKAALAQALQERPGPAPAPTPAPVPVPVPVPTALCTRIAQIAVQEFGVWHPPKLPPLKETHPAATPILQRYYREGVGRTVSAADLQSEDFHRRNFWSAVFISWVMQAAGATQFRRSSAHRVYIAEAKRNRLQNRVDQQFWAFRATELAPQVGDLVCNSRGRQSATYDTIDDGTAWETHCDIVTAILPGGRLRVVGGNVRDNVDAKELRTLPDGRLALDRDQSRYFAVLTCRGAAAAAGLAPQPLPQPRPAPRPQPAPPGGINARVLRVMELLVDRYRYPANGAAGIVGNLVAESGVLPNRIEGSSIDTPMRARDFAGALRDFTPEEVRDRNSAARRGPAKPGIGIAQWTTAARRAALFSHSFAGRPAGVGILGDLEAQVDFLVTELRARGGVNAVVSAPPVTVDAASDEIVYRFEVPGAVLDNGTPRRLLPRTDPRVQRVFAARRALARNALTVYHAAHPPTLSDAVRGRP